MSAWRVGLSLSFKHKRWRRGTLVSKQGTTWKFRPSGYKNPIVVCPIRSEWRYGRTGLIPWPEKIQVVLVKKTLQPFRLKKERVGKWRGAATCRTCTALLRVWQVKGTHNVYVGHLGKFSLVDASLQPLLKPKDQPYFIGRGPLSKTKFKCLKTVSAPAPLAPRLQRPALYRIPARDELSIKGKHMVL